MEVIKGRMYDYNNGRFLSVDPFIQSPTSTQSMNPYTYVFNNPLSGTDPTGYECDPETGKECGNDEPTGEGGEERKGQGFSLNWKVVTYNGKSSSNSKKEDRIDNSDTGSQKELFKRAWENTKDWWTSPGPAAGIQETALSGYQQHISSINKAYEAGDITGAEREIHMANANLNLGTINSFPSTKGDTVLKTLEIATVGTTLKVSSTVKAGEKTATLAQKLANKSRSLPSNQRPNTVAVLVSKDGKVIVGRNQGGVVNNEVGGALQNIRSNQFMGQCAEANCISRALNKGVDVKGSTITTANVRGVNSTTNVHGTAKAPCSVCDKLLDFFGINNGN